MSSAKKGRKIGAVIFLTLIGLSLILLIILYAPIFNISAITVSGSTKYSAEEIKQRSGLVPGENGFRKLKLTPESILELRLVDSETKINQLPYIKSSRVRLRFPDRVEITVTERKAEAFIKYLDSYLIVDREGFVLEVMAERPEKIYKEIKGIEFAKYSIGGQLEAQDIGIVKLAVSIIDAIKSSDSNDTFKLYDVMDWVDIIDSNNAMLSLDGRILVQLNPAAKLQYTIDFTKEIFFKKLNSKETGRILFPEGQNPNFIPE